MMRRFWLGLGGIALALMVSIAPVLAEVSTSGTFTGTQACPAMRSMRRATNPGEVFVQPNTAYEVLAQNKAIASHYRIFVDGAEPPERWVAATCGTFDPNGQVARAPGAAGAAAVAGGVRGTHLLALSWQAAFCAKRPEKTECAAVTPTSRSGTQLSLHGLWPQPEGKKYCNVTPAVRELDAKRAWDQLPEPAMSAETAKRLAAVMPGVQSKLERHEWIVHGTCYGANAEAYFARSAGLTEEVNASKVAKVFAESAGQPLNTSAIRAAFDEAFGEGTGERVSVACSGRGGNRRISEIRISLAGDVVGTAPIGELMRAAKPEQPGCPGGLVVGPGQ